MGLRILFTASIVFRFRQPRWVMAVCALILAPAFVCRGAQPSTPRLENKDVRVAVLTSTSGRFMIIGHDNRESLQVADWTEDVTREVERILGVELQGGGRQATRITLRKTKPTAPGRILESEAREQGRLIQTLTVYNLEKVDYEMLQATLCRLLLRRHVLALVARSSGEVDKSNSYVMPYWLWEGVSQNISKKTRMRNSQWVYDYWRRGKLWPIGVYLTSRGTDYIQKRGGIEGRRPKLLAYDRAMSSVLIQWLQALPDKATRFQNVFEKVASGKAFSPQWVPSLIPGCESLAEMDYLWDRWILRQRRIVHRPGVLTPRHLEQLELELLLYAGDFGIPLGGELAEPVTWEALIKVRKADWIPLFARSKAASLRVMSVGRGKEIDAVVDSYCAFLEFLQKGKREKKLVKLLKKAEHDLQQLTAKVRGAPPDPGIAENAATD